MISFPKGRTLVFYLLRVLIRGLIPTSSLTQIPGDLFILRNVGNIIPPFGLANTGESSAIEYAITQLKVTDIVVCGHSLCGAMKALLNPESLDCLPCTKTWLTYAEATRRIVADKYQGLDGDSRENIAIQENVLVQLENLRTHPSVASALASQTLSLHGWVYKIQSGEVFGYDAPIGQFTKVSEVSSVGMSKRF